jgi:hypothetical protein
VASEYRTLQQHLTMNVNMTALGACWRGSGRRRAEDDQPVQLPLWRLVHFSRVQSTPSTIGASR